MDITKRLYNLVKTVAEKKNISHAAEILFISQPALTKSLNQLEDELGIKLFDRTCKPVQLLPAGEVFLNKAKQICDLNDQLEMELVRLKLNNQKKLRLGISNPRSAAWLPHILTVFSKEFPDIALSITETEHCFFHEALQKNKIDIAIGSNLESDDNHITAEFIRNENWILITNVHRPYLRDIDLENNTPFHPIRINLNDIAGETLILPNSEIWFKKSLKLLFQKNKIPFPPTIPATDVISAYLMASAGVGITFTNPYIPLSLQLSYPDTSAPVYCYINEITERPVFFAYRNDFKYPEIVNGFMQLTLKALRDYPEL